ncbi:hypothetical protein PCANB_000377 [Pneumocystis canis]|nr:hypothetical protein PCANB_000377 [Pneumocystis canis]
MLEHGNQYHQIHSNKFPQHCQTTNHQISYEYTDQEYSTVQSLLDRQLGPEYISYRPGGNGVRVHYLEAWKVINLANEIFGFNGWSSSIQNIQVDYIDEFKDSGRLNLGVSVIVRVTLKNGVYHEDIGYGCVENFKGKGAAFEKAKKQGTTDALKRALRTFGNVLGNCLYDKTYLKEIGKIHVSGKKYNLGELYRHPNTLAHKAPNSPTKPSEQKEVLNSNQINQNTASKNVPALNKESEIYEDGDEFDDIDFQDMDRPIEFELFHQSEFDIEDTFSNFSHSDIVEENIRIAEESHNTFSYPSKNGIQQENPSNHLHNSTNFPEKKESRNEIKSNISLDEKSGNTQKNSENFQEKPIKQAHVTQHLTNHSAYPQNESEHPPDYVPIFVNTRSALTNSGGAIDISSSVAFNPHVDSPSLRKTPGLDHTKSTPIRRKNSLGNTIPILAVNQTKQMPVPRLVGVPPTNNKHYHQDSFQSVGAKRLANKDTIKRTSPLVLNEMSDRILNQETQESFNKANNKKEMFNCDTNGSTTAKRYKA